MVSSDRMTPNVLHGLRQLHPRYLGCGRRAPSKRPILGWLSDDQVNALVKQS